MSNELRFVSRELVTISPTYQPVRPRTRNLGAAILLAAVQDYRSLDEDVHKDAERFLYPQTQESQDALRLGSFDGRWIEPGVAAGFAGSIPE